MRSMTIFSLFLIAFSVGCLKRPELKKEPWVVQPIQQWPLFALTNEIGFDDTTFTGLANSFLINTGRDTIGASCKHLFMVFRNHLPLKTIHLGEQFSYWKLYPKNNPGKSVQIKGLINESKKEPIGAFNTLKNRDWIIFDIEDTIDHLYPLKVRYSPLSKGEIIYGIGWGELQKGKKHPVKTKFQCFQSRGNYYYARLLSKNITPNGRSGSPVIDKNGYLVGITSGAEGKLAVIGSVQYLKGLFDRFGVEYQMPLR